MHTHESVQLQLCLTYKAKINTNKNKMTGSYFWRHCLDDSQHNILSVVWTLHMHADHRSKTTCGLPMWQLKGHSGAD